ncbi:retrograde regulation protein 2 [Ciborinia camelliae]|nr:retrograde regulation protein 2 [Ciborinia camelliae]
MGDKADVSVADPSVITIDNISSRMPPHDIDGAEKSTDHLYALVDMGSNGIRFSISDLSPPTSRLLPCVYRDRASISLYDALHSSLPGSAEFFFDPDTITRVSQHLAHFKRTCDSYGVLSKNIGVFATEAMRTALNRKEMTDEIKRHCGLDVDILSPQVESLLGAMGARSGFMGVEGLMMDLGGGSVQMSFMDSSAAFVQTLEASQDAEKETYWSKSAACAKSMPFGAAKMTAKLKGGDIHDIRTDMRARFQETFQGLCQSFPKLQGHVENEGVTIYFCGGGFRGYGSMLMHTDPINPYPIPSIAGYKVSGKRFKQTKEMLKVNKEEKEKIHGMSKRRREQFPAIVEVVEGIISTVPNIKEVIFCGGGNREGVLYLKLPPHTQETHPLRLLPSPFEDKKIIDIPSMTDILSSALPKDHPGAQIFTAEILSYVVKHMWEHMADISNLNASRALHAPISGPIAGTPGLTHDVIATLSLTLSARWENDLGKIDRGVLEGLREILGHDAAWWCEYVGAMARLICALYPVYPAGGLARKLKFQAQWMTGMGKKGRKDGVRCEVLLYRVEGREMGRGVDVDVDVDLEKVVGKIGKGLGLKRAVELVWGRET